MVLGIRSKSRKKVAIQVDYHIDVVEIKPWPLYQSPKSVQSVLLHWDNGGHGSGSFISGVGDGSIEFSESFRLQVTLLKEASRKGTVHYRYQKNSNLEFYLYEFRNDKGMKGQLLGSAVVNFTDYEIIKEPVTMSIPVNWKRSSKNLGQPVLYINVQPLGKEEIEDVNGSVSGSVNGENEEEAEIASFTDDDVDDDVSSHSSHTINSSAFETTSSSPSLSVKNGSEIEKDNAERISEEHVKPSREHTGPTAPARTFKHLDGNSSQLSPMGTSSKLRSSVNYSAAFPYTPHEGPTPGLKKSVTLTVQSLSSSSSCNQENYEKPSYHKGNQRLDGNVRIPEYAQKSTTYNDVCRPVDEAVSSVCIQEEMNIDHRSCTNSRATQEDERIQKVNVKEATLGDSDFSHSGDMVNNEKQGNGQKDSQLRFKECSNEAKLPRISQDTDRKQFNLRSDTFTSTNRDTGASNSMVKNNKLNHVKMMQLPFESVENVRLSDNSKFKKKSNGIEVAKSAKDACLSTAKEQLPNRAELDSEVEMLKEELKEAAALEVSLYSVVAEHGSSTNKIHAPARRLSRFYFHVCNAKGKKANAARAAISGLILVSKACGNDVQRLTFWLSNSIVLRTIISQTLEKLQLPARSVNHEIRVNISEGVDVQRNGFFTNKGGENNTTEGSDGWDDPQVFMLALEKFEAWIFSRIVESVWWQTMTPHMQSSAAKGSSSKKAYGRRNNLGDFDQGNFSLDLWKKAFKDACERLCPPRAGGHECGCLHVLARLVMEQLVNRLDVAMFNAILRENAEEMPTDPVSDPISDSKVLPIPAGKSSFGAGVQLKNAIGSWSRWLTDLFDIDDNDAPDDNNEQNDRSKLQTPFKPFRLLNALSDLMMLPFEMLADRSTRKEVCPTFAAPLIKRVLYSFVPDEFSPNPIPTEVLEVLDSENNLDDDEDSDTSFPCMASPTIYLPPSAPSLIGVIGEVGSQTLNRNGSSVLKKSYTSDDELDELDSPMASIIMDSLKGPSTAKPISILKKKGNQQLRYQLLREAWKEN